MNPPGSRASTFALAHEGFPSEAEGYHWLRWIDGVDVRGRATGSPLVHVHLSSAQGRPGSASPPGLLDLAHAGGSRAVAVHAATLPLLRLGTVFSAGVAQAPLRMATRSFAFEAGATTTALLRAFDPCALPRPDWWESPWVVLPRRVYPLGDGMDQARCLVLTTGATQVVVPASEAFRVFCAPEPLLAQTLLSGPWELVGDRVVNGSWTERLDDRWEIGLRSGCTGASALPAAAFELTELGRGVASGIHAALIGRGAGWRFLRPAIPYGWTAMELDVAGLTFPPRYARDRGFDRFLALRIEAVRWPALLHGMPARIVYRLDNYNTVRVAPEPGTEAPVRRVPTYGAPVPDDITGAVPLTPDFAPSPSADSVVVAFTVTAMAGGPAVERMSLEETVEVEGTGTGSFDAGELPFASAGRTGGGSSPAAPLRPRPDDGARSVPAFGEITHALDALGRDGRILSWSTVVPIDDKSAVRGGRPAWLFPGWRDGRRNAWSYLPDGRRRSALVATVGLPLGDLHLIEIERRASGEAFSLLLLQAYPDDLQRAVSALLAASAAVDGVWARTVPDLATSATPRPPRWNSIRHPVMDGRIEPARLLRALERSVVSLNEEAGHMDPDGPP